MKNSSIDSKYQKTPSLWGRFLLWKNSLGVRTRIFLYFLFFTALLLVLLWLFQIVLLDEFYRMQKTDMLTSSSESLARNIDNENLLTLASRIAEENNVCILITDGNMRDLLRVETWTGCIIHRMSRMDLRRIAFSVNEENEIAVANFHLSAFRNWKYDAHNFLGRVPASDNGETMSMITVQRAKLYNGTPVYIFLNTLITPVNATVQTLRNELLFISVILVVLSFLISLVLSRHITRPIVETTQAAAALGHAEYEPVTDVGYREIDQLNHQLVKAAEDLRRVEHMQKELIANISHDLRTPLTLIEGYAEAIRDLPGEGTPENMQVIIDETRRLSTLVNSILELNTARFIPEAKSEKAFNLTACIRDIMTRYQKLTEQDGYVIVFEPAEDVIVRTDEMKVQQVIYNLINNALTYTGEDRTVILQQRISEKRVRVEISDSGEGIAPEELPYIWDRYYRGKKPHKRAKIGSGLGLSIVKSILDSYGLPYGVESVQDVGSTFWFELPVAQQTNQNASIG